MKVLAFLFIFASFIFANECQVKEGYASWYGKKFHGRKTSSGEIFNKYKYTAASKDLPLGTYLLVKNPENDREVVVIITDRGPWKKGRIIDLSKAAAEKLGFVKKGIVKVQIVPLSCVAQEEKISEEDHEEIIKDLLNTL
ncbi:MAG: septal ring lytic transglycosylase RlpA family protein [Aquificaceae bacterium]